VVLKVAPSILSADFSRLGGEVEAVIQGGADWIHIDVMDGQFVPNLTMGLPVVKSLRKVTNRPFDVHLMVMDPERYLQMFRDAGGDRLTVHAEATKHLHRCIQQTRALGAAASVALNPSSPLSLIEHVVSDLDQITIMTVNPGFGGQEFIASVVPKIKQARDLIEANGKGRPIEVLIDGGINAETARVVEKAGATVVVAGNAVFSQPDYGRVISAIKGQQRRIDAPVR